MTLPLQQLTEMARHHEDAGERAFLAGDDALASRHWQVVEDLDGAIKTLIELEMAADAVFLQAPEPAMHVAGGCAA